MPTILVIDDEPSILHVFRRAFADPEDTLQTASDGAEGLELVAREPARRGRPRPQPARRVRAGRRSAASARSTPQVPVIFITGHGTTETAIEAMKLGAFDYLLKPLDARPASGSWSSGPSRSAG